MLFTEFSDKEDAFLAADVEKKILNITAGKMEKQIPFTLSGFDEKLIETGGWVEYADQNYWFEAYGSGVYLPPLHFNLVFSTL